MVSRGIGQLQRRVLDFLWRHGRRAPLTELAAAVLAEPTRRSRLVSLRRALHALEARGRVRVLYVRIADETGAPTGVGLHVWVQGRSPEWLPDLRDVPVTRTPKRWERRDQSGLAALRRATQEDVDAWLRRSRTAKGYGARRARTWDLPRTEPPWLPYQLAVRRMAQSMLAVRQNGPLTANVSRSMRRMIERLAHKGHVELLEDPASPSRKYLAVRCAITDNESENISSPTDKYGRSL
jgi:hypothetical protein